MMIDWNQPIGREQVGALVGIVLSVLLAVVLAVVSDDPVNAIARHIAIFAIVGLILDPPPVIRTLPALVRRMRGVAPA